MERAEAYKRHRRVTIRTTDGSTLSGKVDIGIEDRVFDLIIKTENPFLFLLDAEYGDDSGKVLLVNKDNIVWVEPLDE